MRMEWMEVVDVRSQRHSKATALLSIIHALARAAVRFTERPMPRPTYCNLVEARIV